MERGIPYRRLNTGQLGEYGEGGNFMRRTWTAENDATSAMGRGGIGSRATALTKRDGYWRAECYSLGPRPCRAPERRRVGRGPRRNWFSCGGQASMPKSRAGCCRSILRRVNKLDAYDWARVDGLKC